LKDIPENFQISAAHKPWPTHDQLCTHQQRTSTSISTSKGKTTPFSVNLMRSQAICWAAQSGLPKVDIKSYAAEIDKVCSQMRAVWALLMSVLLLKALIP